MLTVALTGNIGSGKSTVARLLAARGATIIDADVLARRAVEPGTPALAAIARRWGPPVLAPDGSLDRAALARIVFADPAERAALDAMVHPEVRRLRDEAMDAARARGARVVVSDIPLLFELNLERGFDLVLLVDAPEAIRLERLVQERGLEREQARRMVAAQQPADGKRARADIVIDNAGTMAALESRVADAWRRIAHAAAGGTSLDSFPAPE